MQDTMSENAPTENDAIGEVTTLDEETTIKPVTVPVTDSGYASEESRPKKLDYSYTQNRELSWLQFDKRVLEEALDLSVPAIERMKFISIFCTNLDEFFMVRVGSLMDLSIIAPDIRENKTNMTPREQLEAIFDAVKPLVKERDEIYHAVASDLKKNGFKELDLEELSKKDRKFARDYYREFIRPVLSPQVVDERHPFPHLRNKELYIATVLTDKDKSQHLGIIPVPDNISPIISDPENPLHFVRAEKLIAYHVKKIFDIYETSEPCIISVTRNADISFDEEKFSDDEGDYRLHVSRLLKKRNRLQPVRLEIEGSPEKALLTGLLKRLKLSKNQVYNYDAPINLGWVFGLDRRVDPDMKRELCYAPFVPRASEEFDINRSILKQIEERDRLLFYPYDSIDPFLRMLQEAATDPDVLSIKITVYRLASESRVAQHLIEAAENGKEVNVLMELRARFDEANNIDWSGRLEEAGCNIIYGMENYKCHSKVCLITKRSDEGVRYITQIGTGNYNEKTARLYTDLSLFTSDAGIGRDAVSFFQNMLIGNLNGNYEKLLVAPVAIKSTILHLIDREIAKGSAGRITLKANSVTERDIIDRLALASQAGVKIRMNIRGICCMLPGIKGKTENLHVRSVVGQFLEHSRIFVFGEGDDMEMYVGSADLMTRNLCHRVEVAVPITTKPAREAIMVFLDKIFADNVKARTLESNGEYKMVAESRDKDMCPTDEKFSVQAWCIDHPLQGLKRSTGSVFAQPSDTVAKDVELDLDFEIEPHVDEEKVERTVESLFATELEADRRSKEEARLAQAAVDRAVDETLAEVAQSAEEAVVAEAVADEVVEAGETAPAEVIADEAIETAEEAVPAETVVDEVAADEAEVVGTPAETAEMVEAKEPETVEVVTDDAVADEAIKAVEEAAPAEATADEVSKTEELAAEEIAADLAAENAIAEEAAVAMAVVEGSADSAAEDAVATEVIEAAEEASVAEEIDELDARAAEFVEELAASASAIATEEAPTDSEAAEEAESIIDKVTERLAQVMNSNAPQAYVDPSLGAGIKEGKATESEKVVIKAASNPVESSPEPEENPNPEPLDFNVDFDKDMSNVSEEAAEAHLTDVTAPMEKIIESRIEVDEVAASGDASGKDAVGAPDTQAAVAENAARDLDLSFLSRSTDDEPPAQGEAKPEEPNTDDVVFEQVGSTMVLSDEEAKVDETPANERLEKERAFMRDFPHTTAKADTSSEGSKPSKEYNAASQETKAKEPEEKKGFFKSLFS